ncbi:MAG: hypothetical protein LIO91_01000, partial [Bacteroidales bacterium]|nr:hypothetical protein [Bacteroidales bacterium]
KKHPQTTPTPPPPTKKKKKKKNTRGGGGKIATRAKVVYLCKVTGNTGCNTPLQTENTEKQPQNQILKTKNYSSKNTYANEKILSPCRWLDIPGQLLQRRL